MTSVLFVHNGWPGRFGFLAEALLKRGWSCVLINGPDGTDLPGVKSFRWSPSRGSTSGIFDIATRAEADMIRGFAAAEIASSLSAQGFQPDLIIGHPGWGEMLFLREVFPNARQIQIGEFFYRTTGADVNFDPRFNDASLHNLARVHAKNATLSLSYSDADCIVAPTPFQASLLPAAFQSHTSIIHEGIDTTRAKRKTNVDPQSLGLKIDHGAPIITFINRYFEPTRGFVPFMRAMPGFLNATPDAHVLLIGSELAKGYSAPRTDGKTWKQGMLEELDGQIDLKRVHFTGPLSYEDLISALSMSTAHVYLTYPFVLSWSLLDAMACECLIVASDTAPVRDVVKHDVNGMLVDFFDHEALASRLADICQNSSRYQPLRQAARDTIVSQYDRRSKTEPAWMALIDEELAAVGL